jgi:hypothetical protein
MDSSPVKRSASFGSGSSKAVTVAAELGLWIARSDPELRNFDRYPENLPRIDEPKFKAAFSADPFPLALGGNHTFSGNRSRSRQEVSTNVPNTRRRTLDRGASP